VTAQARRAVDPAIGLSVNATVSLNPTGLCDEVRAAAVLRSEQPDDEQGDRQRGYRGRSGPVDGEPGYGFGR